MLAFARVSCVTNQLTVRDVMTYGVTALPPLVHRSNLVDVLLRCPYAVHGLPSTWLMSAAGVGSSHGCHHASMPYR